MFELRSLLIEHANVWQRACAGEELESVEAAQAAQLYMVYVDFTYTQGVTAALGCSTMLRSLPAGLPQICTDILALQEWPRIIASGTRIPDKPVRML